MTTTVYWYSFFAIIIYFIILLTLSYFRSRNAVLQDYLVGSRNATWWLVSFGMISDSLSGVTYVSVPGNCAMNGPGYLFIVLGNLVGSLIITYVILPLFFQRKLISIYSYLKEHINVEAEKTSAFLFFISRSFGSAARLYLSINLLYHFLSPIIPFSIYTAFSLAMLLILLYTWKGGIKSLIWTDAYQSFFLVLGFLSVLIYLFTQINGPIAYFDTTKIVTDPLSAQFYLKLFLGGVFINIAMNGLDQNMMQKCLSCSSLKDAQKNFLGIGIIAFVLSTLFVFLGSVLASYYQQHTLAFPVNELGHVMGDQILTNVVFNFLPIGLIIIFILGLTAATFSSADSVLTTLATSFHFDLLTENLRKKIPVRALHFLMAVLILLLLFMFHNFQAESMVDTIFKYATCAYGPLLGLFILVIWKKTIPTKSWIVVVSSILAISISYTLNAVTPKYGYSFGLELLLFNALIFILFFSIGTKLRAA